jgi:hypothetical protein
MLAKKIGTKKVIIYQPQQNEVRHLLFPIEGKALALGYLFAYTKWNRMGFGMRVFANDHEQHVYW